MKLSIRSSSVVREKNIISQARIYIFSFRSERKQKRTKNADLKRYDWLKRLQFSKLFAGITAAETWSASRASWVVNSYA